MERYHQRYPELRIRVFLLDPDPILLEEKKLDSVLSKGLDPVPVYTQIQNTSFLLTGSGSGSGFFYRSDLKSVFLRMAIVFGWS